MPPAKRRTATGRIRAFVDMGGSERRDVSDLTVGCPACRAATRDGRTHRGTRHRPQTQVKGVTLRMESRAPYRCTPRPAGRQLAWRERSVALGRRTNAVVEIPREFDETLGEANCHHLGIAARARDPV